MRNLSNHAVTAPAIGLDTVVPKVNLPEGQHGPWVIERFEAKPDPLTAIRMQINEGRNYVPGHYTRLCRNGQLVMTDTPDERWDHYDVVRAARGSVLISGLGFGMVLQAILAKPEVESVTVLEISQDLIDLVGPHYEDPRLTIICANALEWKPPRGVVYDVVWHDIWDDMSEDNLPEMATLNRRYARKAKWKGCWGQKMILQLRARYGG